MTDKPTPKEIENLFVEETGFDPDDFPAAIFGFTRAALTKWGQPAQAAEPVAWLRNTTDPQPHAVTNLKYRSAVDAKAGVEYIPVFAVPQPVAREPLDEARRLFDAGWKAAAMFCDREDVVADGIIGFGACPQFEAAFSAAHGIKGGQHGTE